MNKRLNQRIDSIQILRLISAFTISISHITFIVMKCNIVFGVDIFLIITGFLAMYTTRDLTEFKVKDYAIKKIVRLVPMYWIMTITTFTVSLLFKGAINDAPTIEELVKSLLFIPYSRVSRVTNVIVIRPIVGPAHTLMYDVYFYIIFAICTKISIKYRGITASAVLLLVYFLGRISESTSVFLMFYSNAWVLDLVLGILLFYIYKNVEVRKIHKMSKAALMIVCIFCFVWLIIEGTKDYSYIPYFIRKEIPAFLFVLSFITVTKGIQFHKGLIRLGDISYSYYLIHYFCLMIVTKFIVGLEDFSMKGLLCALTALGLAAAISYCTWSLIEKKFSKWMLRHLSSHA